MIQDPDPDPGKFSKRHDAVATCTRFLSAKTYKNDRLSERMEGVRGKDNEVERIIRPSQSGRPMLRSLTLTLK